MLRLHDLQDNTALSLDGEFGTIKDFLYDDLDWTVRYIVADIEQNNTAVKRVLLLPGTLSEVNLDESTTRFDLPLERILTSPALDNQLAVSRQLETQLYDHYEFPYYWRSGELPSNAEGDLTGVPLVEMNADVHEQLETASEDEVSHLHSVWETLGYGIQARDGEIGMIDDFIVDETDWQIQNIIVNTGNWLVGRRVLLSPSWISKISWVDKVFEVDLTREHVEQSPVYDPEAPLDTDYNERLADYYRKISRE